MLEKLEIAAQKQALRTEMRARRAVLSASERVQASNRLSDQLLHFFETRPERIVGVYLSLPSEISLDSIIETLLEGGVTVAAPRVDVERSEMSFWRLTSLEDIEIGPWNVRQPKAVERIDELPLILAPGLAFDPQGGRLGMGGGWYDRFLEAAKCVVGVGFDFQILPQVPLENHDIRVDFVVSEKQWHCG